MRHFAGVIVGVFHGEVVTAYDITGWRPETPGLAAAPDAGVLVTGRYVGAPPVVSAESGGSRKPGDP